MEGFPKPLETILMNLLKTFELTLWNIKGGENFTQVYIRFGTEDISNFTVQRVGYRKVSNEKLKRDYNRAQKWRHENDNRCGSDDERQTEHVVELHENTLRHNIAPTESSPVFLTNTNTEVQKQGAHDLNGKQGSVSGEAILEVNTVHSWEVEGICQQNLAASSSIQKVESNGSVVVEDDYDSDDSSEEEYFKCNICSTAIVEDSKWHRCTECDDFDICNTCHKKNHHSKHQFQIHEFVIPDDCTKGYCDSCGFKFRPQSFSFYVNQCEICEDYALCKKCMAEGMHKKHADHLKQVRALDYINDIG